MRNKLLSLFFISTVLVMMFAAPITVQAADTEGQPRGNANATATGTPTSAPSSSTDSELDKKLGLNDTKENFNIISTMKTIASLITRVMGYGLALFGGFRLILAWKDQDSNGISSAVPLLIIAAVLISFDAFFIDMLFN